MSDRILEVQVFKCDECDEEMTKHIKIVRRDKTFRFCSKECWHKHQGITDDI